MDNKIFTVKAWTFKILDEELFYKHITPDIEKNINTLLAYNIIALYQK